MYTIPRSYFDDITRSVCAPTVKPSAHSTYDLQGRPSDRTQKGVIIRNGKKVLMR
ncbi:MAG: hypothetical protein K6B45_09525 [Bacteroidaceae bacterium]|nr:hypothetical protein [Bacteroidaceae bacterium]